MKLTPRKIFILVVLALIIIIVLFASRMRKAETSGLVTPLDYQETGFPVEVISVSPEDLELSLSISGTLTAERDIYVSAETSGRVISIPARLGDEVRQGGLMALLDPEPAELALKQAEAAVASAQAVYEPALKDLERIRELYREGDVSPKALETAVMAERSLKAALNSAVSARDMAVRRLNDARLTAPFTGQVAELRVELGQLVSPGMPVARLVDIDTVEIKVGLTRDELSLVAAGMSVSVFISGEEGERAKGYIDALGPAASADGTFPAEIIIPNPGMKLKPGTVAEAKIVFGVLKNELILPRTSIIQRRDVNIVFVTEEGKALERKVVLGGGDADYVAVTEGLSAGDTVIVKGHSTLKNGSSIRIIN